MAAVNSTLFSLRLANSLPLSLSPSLSVRHYLSIYLSILQEYATTFDLSRNVWSIGVDLIVYRDGRDSIGWHADDTQAETCVLAVVVESDGMRPVCIRPNKRVRDLEDGDEEVELYPGQGDGYELDAGCQHGYEHSLPKKKEVKARRMVAIFREGAVREIGIDTGRPCCPSEYERLGLKEVCKYKGSAGPEIINSLPLATASSSVVCGTGAVVETEEEEIAREGEEKKGEEGRSGGGEGPNPPNPPNSPNLPQNLQNPALKPSTMRAKVVFGRPDPTRTSIKEGSMCSRSSIYNAQLHNSDQRGVSGNIEHGADAVVLARNDSLVRERDGFTWLRYTSARKQGGGGLATR